MKSRQRSYGKIFLFIAFFVSSCTLVHRDDRTEGQSLETSLKSDQSEIEELRKNIPEEKRVENDTLKQILDLTGEVKDPPHKVRQKFNRAMQRLRQDRRKEDRRAREDFNRAEKKAREDFLEKLKKEREEFKGRKADRKERQRFYEDQDRRRRDFTADQRDRRTRFNADMKQKQDDFNAMVRERTNEFTQEMRNYTQRYNEKKKLDEEARRSGYESLRSGE